MPLTPTPTASTHPWQKAALVVQRVVRGFFSRKGLMTMITSRTAAAITIQRMQRGHAVRQSLARARSSSGGGGGGVGGGVGVVVVVVDGRIQDRQLVREACGPAVAASFARAQFAPAEPAR